MFLDQVAQRWQGPTIEVWDAETDSFLASDISCRLSVVDRFLSTFNRPTRRRMLYHDPAAALPASRVIRDVVSGEVFMAGQTRLDAMTGKAYGALTILHLATEEPHGTSGRCRVVRKVSEGPADDPGWLVDKQVELTWCDTEYTGASTETGAYDLKIAGHIVFLPQCVSLERWDMLHVNGMVLRVMNVYGDSGFTGARVDQEADERVNFVIRTNEGKRYDHETLRYVDDARDYNVTGIVTKGHRYSGATEDSDDYIDVVVETRHIGFVPKPDMVLAHAGREWTIKSVDVPANGEQYVMRCD